MGIEADERATMFFQHKDHLVTFDASETMMRRVLAGVHDSYLAEFDDDLDAVLGAPAGPEGIAGCYRTPTLKRRRSAPSVQGPGLGSEQVLRAQRLDRLLGQLVNMARAAYGRCSSPEFATALDRADRLRAGPAAAADADVVQVRRMAMAAQELIDRLDPGDTAGPLPTFEPRRRDRELRCA
ncbi:DUF6415 family natural product biosynthesis protein [Streptomyces sp. NPDC059080]|uniref:DUF6415 family natural product biosynthesis protein n=1 Tax=Streptomyces sp. NPDC059080 TaxID=3346718 RepID=UPI00367CAC17